MAFEVVEIAVVGFTLSRYGPGSPQAWLQVIYLAAGAAMVVLGIRLAAIEAPTTVRRLRSASHV